MTKTLQLLRGTTAQNNSFTGHAGELTVDTTTNELRLHDGSTAGGFTIPKKSDCQGLLGGGTAGTLLTNSGTAGTVNSTSIDATPTDGSNNPVASNGVYDALATKANTNLDNLTSVGEQKIFKPGFVSPFAGSKLDENNNLVIPDGWLVCNGQAVSRTTYADLFTEIGTTYGSGDGSTTFNLPDFTAGVPIGANTLSYIGYTDNGQIPNLKGYIAHRDIFSDSAVADNTLFKAGTGGTESYVGATPNTRNCARWDFDASSVSGVYTDFATRVRPAGIGMRYLIKY